MATPMITRLASMAEYVVLPGAILVAYFTTRGSGPVKKENRPKDMLMTKNII